VFKINSEIFFLADVSFFGGVFGRCVLFEGIILD